MEGKYNQTTTEPPHFPQSPRANMVSFRFFSRRKADNTATQQTPKVDVQDGAAGPGVGSDKMCVIFTLLKKEIEVNCSSLQRRPLLARHNRQPRTLYTLGDKGH